MTKKQKVGIPCPACGVGMVELQDTLQEVYDLVEKGFRAVGLIYRVGHFSSQEIGPTAINERLRRLEVLGLVEKRKVGRGYHYTVRKP